MKTYVWTAPEKITTVKMDKDENGEVIQKQEEKDNPFEGTVILKVPKYTERLQFMKTCNFGSKVEDGVNYDSMIEMIKIAKDHITKVELKRKEDGQEFTTVDDLEYDSEGSEILNELGTKILGGVKLGKF